jgi:hypothetical protein
MTALQHPTLQQESRRPDVSAMLASAVGAAAALAVNQFSLPVVLIGALAAAAAVAIIQSRPAKKTG